MVTIYDVDVNALIEKAAEELKHVSAVQPPEWATYVKTGNHKERPPVQKDWWYVRSAAVLLKVHRLGPIGVSKLRVKYGGKKNRGHRPGRFIRGSGSILRKILQQLEKAGLIAQVSMKKDEKGRKGRILAGKGMKLLNAAAKKAAQAVPVRKHEEERQRPAVSPVSPAPSSVSSASMPGEKQKQADARPVHPQKSAPDQRAASPEQKQAVKE